MNARILSVVLALAASAADAESTVRGLFISNHDQRPSHRVVHEIVGRTNFVYDARGAREKVKGEAIAYLIRDSENVTIRNLRLDWERPCLTEARVEGFSGGKTVVSVDRTLFPYAVRGGRLQMTGPGWTNAVWLAKAFDGRTREQLAEALDVRFDGEAEELPDGRLALGYDFSRLGVGMRPGDVIVFRPKLRPYPAVFICDSRNVTLEDVVIHDAYGMAVLAQRSENVTWRGTGTAADRTSGVFPRPGSYASTQADASHFSNVKGRVLVENCWFEGMMDDAINVHSTCLAITNVVAANRIRCRYRHEQAIGFDVFRPGERLRFIAGRTLENGPEATVTAVERHDAREITLTLDRPLPPDFGVGDAVENADYQCAVAFRGNRIRNNRARGALFTTPHPVRIENNVFEKSTGSALLFAGDNNHWFESGACRDVVVRGNVFSNCCTAASKHGFCRGLLSFYPVVEDLNAQKRCYHANILVEDNRFFTFDVPLLFAISTENLTWRRNSVVRNDDYRSWGLPPVVLRKCRHVTIDGVRKPE